MTRVYQETSESVGGGGGRKKQCGFIGVHKQAGLGGYGRRSRFLSVRTFFSPLHSFSNIKPGPKSLHREQGGAGFTGGGRAHDGSIII